VIDWITSIIPCFHSSFISDGKILRIDSSGEIQWETNTFKSVVGSHDSSIRVRTEINSPGHFLRVDGNPVKFLQGHNLFGTDDLSGLNYGFLERLAEILELKPTESERMDWKTGNYKLGRVDCAVMFDVGSKANSLAWIRQAERLATMAHKGRGQLVKGCTLYFGQHSRRNTSKFYCKGQEFLDNGHPDILAIPKMVDYANRGLRYETAIRSKDLKKLNLALASDWSSEVSYSITMASLGRLHMSTPCVLDDELIEGLKPSLQAVYRLWKTGVDIRSMYPKTTFYRYRSQLMKDAGVDIALLQPSTEKKSNVIPLYRIIEAVVLCVLRLVLRSF